MPEFIFSHTLDSSKITYDFEEMRGWEDDEPSSRHGIILYIADGIVLQIGNLSDLHEMIDHLKEIADELDSEQ